MGKIFLHEPYDTILVFYRFDVGFTISVIHMNGIGQPYLSLVQITRYQELFMFEKHKLSVWVYGERSIQM